MGLIWALLIGVAIGAVFVTVFDWAANLRNEQRRERWK